MQISSTSIFPDSGSSSKQSQECTQLAVPTFWKSHGHGLFMMVSFSIKPGQQTDETEYPNLVTKQNSKVSIKAFLSAKLYWYPNSTQARTRYFTLVTLSTFRPLRRGSQTDLKQQEIKELLAGSYRQLFNKSAVFSKLEIGIVKLKLKSESRMICFFQSGWYSIQLDIVH